MKKLILLLAITVLGFSACKKEDTSAADASAAATAAAQAAADDATIQAYIKANNITATKDPSGVYYSVITAGAGAYPTSTSVISVNYTGTLVTGTQFDKGNLTNTALGGLIKGWQYGIPHINAGGRIMLLIPSALGYGATGAGTIPANSVLVFTIDLISFR
ncbi:FKBP-type peptidyl-prolyl cis-trans isomerase [Mucilaginibacter ginkgonis]|uniref:Peptidyl-prolyl cis-trans isomerase n=1 Tax=Mucilaginibacter ginkgonis TaxID=2682091 RepID=A0A6I4I2A8_9SPHI|nr:FKBP-type peptidyl-prolyl cis-trans isomerase [Mucilaginibacter ginkgonis]QQL48918.1 FKBP-type peptidyl-prolyl cis-trans isomerase [Mucilaginibacter ginkgonis]